MDTPEEFAGRAYAFLVVCQEKGWLDETVSYLLDDLLNQAPMETMYLGWAHIAQAMKNRQP